MRKEGKEHGWAIGRALASWCLATLLLVPVVTFLATRLHMNAQQLPWLSCAVLFFSALMAGFVLGRDAQRQRAVFPSVLCGLTAAVLQLMIGFISFGEEMNLMGLLRVAFSCVIGAVLGGLLSSRHRRNPGKGKFVIKKAG